jgi:DNA-binding Lrp family transcriptional regulator
LNENQMKILKFMSEVTGRTDMNEFARKIGLTPSQILEQIQELAKADFVKKVGSGYGITEKGKATLKAVAPVPANMAFHFYLEVDQPTSMSARTIKEFYQAIKQVPAASLEFHLYRGDFENWIRSTVNDPAFALEFAEMKKSELKGEPLRKEIAKATETRYGIEET